MAVESLTITEPPTSGDVLRAAADSFASFSFRLCVNALNTAQQVPLPQEQSFELATRRITIGKEAALKTIECDIVGRDGTFIIDLQGTNEPALASFIH